MNNSDIPKLPDTSYSAKATLGWQPKTLEIGHVLESYLIVNKASELFRSENPSHTIYTLIGNVEHVPSFLHPIIYKNKAYVDGRSYMNREGAIRNPYEYSLLLRRASLDLEWVVDRDMFYGQMPLAVDTFSTWFAHGLQKQTNASLMTATNYRILAAIYYMGLFNTQSIAHEKDIEFYILKKLPRIIGIPSQLIQDLFAINMDAIIGLYCNGTTRQHDRLTLLAENLTLLTNEEYQIDVGIILNSLCRGAFMAANAIEITSISLEHPPTFLAMMSFVVAKGMQNNTNLGKALMGVSRKHDMQAFAKFIENTSLGA